MLDRKPQITVVIPAYRASRFIARAIESVLGQEGVRLELIVVDDASPDDTVGRVEAITADRANTRIIRLARNGGPSIARNVGLRNAQADWVAVLDADDAFEQGRLARLLDVGVRIGADVIADNVRFVNKADNSVSEPMFRSYKELTLLTVHSFTEKGRPGTGELDLGLLKPMYRRKFLQERDLFYPEDIRHGEDFTLYFNLLLAGAKFVMLPDPGYLWTLRNSGQSQTSVDYLGQQREALRLAQLPDVRPDLRLVGLLRERGQALSRLHFGNLFTEAKAERRYGQLLSLALQHPFLAKRTSGELLRKVSRWRNGVILL